MNNYHTVNGFSHQNHLQSQFGRKSFHYRGDSVRNHLADYDNLLSELPDIYSEAIVKEPPFNQSEKLRIARPPVTYHTSQDIKETESSELEQNPRIESRGEEMSTKEAILSEEMDRTNKIIRAIQESVEKAFSGRAEPSNQSTSDDSWTDLFTKAGYGLMLVTCNVLLVIVSGPLFGSGWEGYIRTLVLEIGAGFLWAYQSHIKWYVALTKFSAAILALITAAILYKGTATSHQLKLETALQNDEFLSSKRAAQERLESTFKLLPEDRIKQRLEINGNMEKISGEIDARKILIKQKFENEGGFFEFLLSVDLMSKLGIMLVNAFSFHLLLAPKKSS